MSSVDVATAPEAPAAPLVHGRPEARAFGNLFRACELCRHSTALAGRLLCDSPAVRLAGQPEALDVARAASGSCGPNARHLDMPGWH
ncbi:hypothetical protein [Variovorax sp. V15]|uniref:hypothetical protein n=1 Tax=Variovorax sp. V15 TaxID=3065952 RepID=UPI0034E8A2FE